LLSLLSPLPLPARPLLRAALKRSFTTPRGTAAFPQGVSLRHLPLLLANLAHNVAGVSLGIGIPSRTAVFLRSLCPLVTLRRLASPVMNGSSLPNVVQPLAPANPPAQPPAPARPVLRTNSSIPRKAAAFPQGVTLQHLPLLPVNLAPFPPARITPGIGMKAKVAVFPRTHCPLLTPAPLPAGPVMVGRRLLNVVPHLVPARQLPLLNLPLNQVIAVLAGGVALFLVLILFAPRTLRLAPSQATLKILSALILRTLKVAVVVSLLVKAKIVMPSRVSSLLVASKVSARYPLALMVIGPLQTAPRVSPSRSWLRDLENRVVTLSLLFL
jgi:hypothetical protein